MLCNQIVGKAVFIFLIQGCYYQFESQLWSHCHFQINTLSFQELLSPKEKIDCVTKKFTSRKCIVQNCEEYEDDVNYAKGHDEAVKKAAELYGGNNEDGNYVADQTESSHKSLQCE